MFCFRYKKLLIPYSEGELDKRIAGKVEAHLAKCAACRAELAMLKSVSGALRQTKAPAMEPANDLWAKLNARIADDVKANARKPRFRTPQAATAFAAAMLFAVVGYSLIKPELSQDEMVTKQPEVSRKSVEPTKTQGKENAEAVEKQAVRPEPAVTRIATKPSIRNIQPRTQRVYITADKPATKAVSVNIARDTRPATIAVQSSRTTETNAKIEMAAIPAPAITFRAEANDRSMSYKGPVSGSFRSANTNDNLENADEARTDRNEVALAKIPGDHFQDNRDKADSKIDESMVDVLNETEETHVSALFAYP